MTNLTKPVKRVSKGQVYHQGKARNVVISIELPHLIGLRLQGCKKTYRLSAVELYWMAVKQSANEAKNRKKARG